MLRDIISIGIDTATITRYSQSHLIRNESVLEHTGFVSMFCLILSDRIPDVDKTELLSRAIVHDMEESIVGDISRTTKYFDADVRSSILRVEKYAMRTISSELGGSNFMYDLWARSKDDSIEGRIVQLADAISVLLKVYEETIILNNRSIKTHVENLIQTFVSMIDDDNEVICSIVAEALEICEEIKEAV